MLPPIDQSVLRNNPEFSALYTTLTTSILNPNGSTKNDPAAAEREAVQEGLKRHRLRAAKHHLLVGAISAAQPVEADARTDQKPARRVTLRPNPTTAELPPELLDLLVLLPPLLSAPHLSPDSAALLLSNPPFSSLARLLPLLAPLVSARLHASAVHLARLASPSTNASYVHRTVPGLPGRAAELRRRIDTATESLSADRLAAAEAIAGEKRESLLARHAGALASGVRALEAKHGGVARGLELRAEGVSQDSRRQAAEAEAALWGARGVVYAPAAAAALAAYARHLRDGRARLREAIRDRGAELREYGVQVGDEQPRGERERAKERTMREIARVYGEMEGQIEDARADLERLGRA